MALDFNSRVRLLTQHLLEFLAVFRQPEHMTDEAAAMYIGTMAEAINSRISASLSQDGLVDVVARMQREVIATYRGRDWPTPAHFVAALPRTDAAAEPDIVRNSDAAQISAERIKRGEPVGAGWLWGRLAVQLIHAGQVSEELLEPRRRMHRKELQDLYGAEAEQMIQRLEAQHAKAIEDASQGAPA